METHSSETAVTVPAEHVEPKSSMQDEIQNLHPVKPPFKRLPGTVLILIVIALILIAGGAFFLSTFSSGNTSNLHTPETSPVVTVQVTPTITLPVIPPTGIWIRVVYPGTFVWNCRQSRLSLPDFRSGDKFYKTLRSDGLIQATVRKQDYTGDTLAVEVYVNGSMIAHRTVAKPMGEIALLIDANGNLPGVPPSSNVTSQTPAGNNQLVYL